MTRIHHGSVPESVNLREPDGAGDAVLLIVLLIPAMEEMEGRNGGCWLFI